MIVEKLFRNDEKEMKIEFSSTARSEVGLPTGRVVLAVTPYDLAMPKPFYFKAASKNATDRLSAILRLMDKL